MSARSDHRVARGARAEDMAADHLVARGHRLVERNFRCKLGEIDIVSRDGDTLVFTEVRSRASATHGTGLEAVTPAKQRKVAAVARAYLALRRPAARGYRFDVVGITAGELTHVEDAFRLGD